MSTTNVYVKHHSFKDFVTSIAADIDEQRQRVIRLCGRSADAPRQAILAAAVKDLNTAPDDADFKITPHIADELSRIDDDRVPRYVFHRYRYDVYPKKMITDNYPPYMQIEPTSICNYRCVFCYQTDTEFTTKDKGFMGSMSFDLFKDIIDQIQGHVEMISLASRGEPLLCKDIDRMLEYCVGKFVGLKLNTNASMLSERHCHAILAGGINSVVISADAATEPLYSQLRVKGNLEKVLTNVKLLNDVKKKHYPASKIITRVSGVRYGSDQDMDSMVRLWGDMADQVSFVAYNPWENVYDCPDSNVTTPCSDLWRRMFVWFDGKVNPCDVDFKSTLSVGNLQGKTVPQLWQGEAYENLRTSHLQDQRGCVSPCKRCVFV